MNSSLEVDREDQILKIKATHLLDPGIGKDIFSVAAANLNCGPMARILLDLSEARIKKDEPMIGAFELTAHMRAVRIPPETKFALVFTDSEAHAKYFEQVANAGGYNVRHFKTLEEARKWLS